MQLIDDVLSDSLRLHVHELLLRQMLVRIVLRVRMLREVFHVLLRDGRVQIAEVVEVALGQQFELLAPDDCYAHVFACICNNGTGQEVWVNGHETLLVEAEVGEELRILLEVLCQFGRRLLEVSIVLTDHGRPEYLLVLKEASLRDEQLDIVVYGEDHQLPVDDVEDLTLSRYDEVAIVPVAHLVVKSIGTRIFDLQVLGGDEEADERDEYCIVLFILRQLG